MTTIAMEHHNKKQENVKEHSMTTGRRIRLTSLASCAG
jgi:hypothetical protein